MCFRAEAENVKKGYNHATLNFCFLKHVFREKIQTNKLYKAAYKGAIQKTKREKSEKRPKNGF